MSNDTKTQQIKLELERDKRDIADLWRDAIRSYKGITGVALQPEFNSSNDMLNFGVDQMNAFHKFRHDQKKVDKLRTLFTKSMGYIELGSSQLISAVSGAFPPAAAVGTALTILLKACKQVSADYDVVTAFFEDMNAFLERITILKSRLPSDPAYRNCLMDVFTSFLAMCAFATKYIELGRFKKWIIGVAKLGAETGELVGARKTMDTAISRLQSATEFAILGNTEKIQSMNTELQQNQEMQTRMMQSQTSMLESVVESQQSVRSDLMNIQKLLVAYDKRYKEDSERRPTASSARKKPATANRVRSFVGEMIDPQYEYDNLKDSFIADASVWPFQEQEWETWIFPDMKEADQTSTSILTISGDPGTGKSHIAVAAHDHLARLADQDPEHKICVAHYYFREATAGLDALENAIKWIAVQIAEQSFSLCEKINAEIGRDDLDYWDSDWTYQDWWNKLIEPLFANSTGDRLYVVWDGLDELTEDEQNNAFKFFSTLRGTNELNIRILCTSRPETSAKLKELGATTITVTLDKQTPDLKALIWSHLNGDNALRKLSRYVKQRIATTLEEKSRNMLYAEHMLRTFETTGREPLILKVLDGKMPETLQNLYEGMLSDLQSRLRLDQRLGVRILLCWMAFSHRLLTFAEHVALLKLFSGDSFDLERDLQDRYLARFLRIAAAEERVSPEASQSATLEIDLPDNADYVYDDSDLPLKFQGRSLRAFFRTAKENEVSLRTPAVEAQRRIFLFCARTLRGILKDVHPGLREYAANKWVSHLSSLHKLGTDKMSEHDLIDVVESMSALINDQPVVAVAMETLSTEDPYTSYRYVDLPVIAHFARTALSIGDKVSAATRKWAETVVADQYAAYLPVARGHTTNWFQAKDLKSVQQSYEFARAALQTTRKADLTLDSVVDDNVNDEGWTYKEEEIIDLFNVFDDLPKTAEAHRAVAILLKHGAYNKTALDHVNMAIKMSTDADNTFLVDATLLSIQINLAMKSWKNARDMVTKMLESNITMPPNLLRQYLVARAQAEAGAENLDLAIQSFAEAEKAGEEEPIPGELLREEFDTIIDKDEPSAALDAVKRWKPVERLAWMTWNYYDDSEFHYNFQRAAGRCGQQDFMTKVYQEVIDLLDRIDASAPIKCQLATAKWKVCGDIEVAKSVFNEVLDKPSTGKQYALTNENPEDILLWATSSMSSLNYEQFRYARDPTVKMALYLETKDLVHKPLAQSISVSSSGLTYHSLILSRMARKMVGSQEFYRHLNDAFANCYAALTDKVGWNDCDVLLTLGVVLSRMEGLEEDARIALSCTFADLKADDSEDKKDGEVDGKVNGQDAGQKESVMKANCVSGSKHDEKDINGKNDGKTNGEEEDEEDDEDDVDEDGENDEEEEDDDGDGDDENNEHEGGKDHDKPSQIDEGDLADVEYLCDGECKPCTTWNNWKDTASLMHLCLTCDKVMLCDACHAKRLSYNNGADSSRAGISYCGEDHEYIVGPIEGWGGIKDGMMRIRGREDVKFKDWLDDLKERRWKEAWDRFWLSED